jgi:hypothetical protein
MKDNENGVPESRELVVIRVFVDLPEALLAKGSLESAGIECFLVDDNMVRLDWFMVNVFGGIKLMVPVESAETARAFLNRPMLVHSPEEE